MIVIKKGDHSLLQKKKFKKMINELDKLINKDLLIPFYIFLFQINF